METLFLGAIAPLGELVLLQWVQSCAIKCCQRQRHDGIFETYIFQKKCVLSTMHNKNALQSWHSTDSTFKGIRGFRCSYPQQSMIWVCMWVSLLQSENQSYARLGDSLVFKRATILIKVLCFSKNVILFRKGELLFYCGCF